MSPEQEPSPDTVDSNGHGFVSKTLDGEDDAKGTMELSLRDTGILFGHIYRDDDQRTIFWEGMLDFRNLVQHTLECAATMSAEDTPLKMEIIDVSDELTNYELENRGRIAKLLSDERVTQEIVYARFDWANSSSFFADNPQHVKKPMFAISLPRESDWPTDLASWILRHHHTSTETPLDKPELTDELCKYLNDAA